MSQDIFLTSLNSGVEIFKITADNTLVFNSGIAVNITTGEVSIPNGLGFSEESKQFWDGVGLFAKARISELESENVWLRDQITAAREALSQKESQQGLHLSQSPDSWQMWDGRTYIGAATRGEVAIWRVQEMRIEKALATLDGGKEGK